MRKEISKLFPETFHEDLKELLTSHLASRTPKWRQALAAPHCLIRCPIHLIHCPIHSLVHCLSCRLRHCQALPEGPPPSPPPRIPALSSL